MSDAYRTIDVEAQGEYKDRGSKFIAYLFPMETLEVFSEKLSELRALHFKACHCCSAYRLRDGTQKSSDDGEPSGSAGKPILNQLLSKEVVDVGCIVVRYFGGTKLGVSGLIQAYKQAAVESLEASEILTKYETEAVVLSFDYAIMGKLMEALKYLKLHISGKDLSAEPSLTLEVNQSEVESTITNIKAKLLGRDSKDVDEDTEVAGLRFVTESSLD